VSEVLDYVYPRLLPELVLLATACLLFLGGTFRRDRHVWGGVALLGLAAAGATLALASVAPLKPDLLYASPVLGDGFALWFTVLALAGVFVLVLASWDEVPDAVAAEYHACLLLIAAGLALTASANELVTLFVGLELVSIPTYILLYLPRLDNPAREAAMKYFLLSVFSSALLLFGFSYLYGLAGTTNMPALVEALSRPVSQPEAALPRVTLVALVMIVAGLGFRLTVVPFHFYAPDVYQGTPTCAAAMLAFVPKVAGFAALLRLLGYVPYAVNVGDPVGVELRPILGGAFSDKLLGGQVPHLLWVLAVITMTLGNVLALLQDNVKRMLAYSSVAHAGYMLMGLVVARFQPAGSGTVFPSGVEAVMFYLAAYGAMTIGAFTVLGVLSRPGRPVETVDDLAGLSRSHPGMALMMLGFLLSLIGVPFLAGFWGKLWLFLGAVAVRPEHDMSAWMLRGLALIAAVNAAIGAWYYLRIAAVMYLRNPLKPLERVSHWPGLAALALCLLVTLAAGVYPGPLLATVRAALPSP
jgi:NADH-quinone oxidoreductase subunit N